MGGGFPLNMVRFLSSRKVRVVLNFDLSKALECTIFRGGKLTGHAAAVWFLGDNKVKNVRNGNFGLRERSSKSQVEIPVELLKMARIVFFHFCSRVKF